MGNERVRGMMKSVAAGAEELNASVREISEAMVKSKETAVGAVDRVASANSQAKRLSDATQAMSGIVEMIGDITGQINLLALNATMESARAGEAGRGFAVVAAEVKNFANQAKQATDKIGIEIGGLNSISDEVVSALNEIKTEIQNVCEYVTSTAAAVEEQSTVTGGNVVEHAAGRGGSVGDRCRRGLMKIWSLMKAPFCRGRAYAPCPKRKDALKTSRNIRGAPSPTPRPESARSRRS